jgi:hypothetical protein
MPDCLEKSLYKLTYFAEVLKANAKDSIFKEANIESAIIQTIAAIDKQFKVEAFSK